MFAGALASIWERECLPTRPGMRPLVRLSSDEVLVRRESWRLVAVQVPVVQLTLGWPAVAIVTRARGLRCSTSSPWCAVASERRSPARIAEPRPNTAPGTRACR